MTDESQEIVEARQALDEEIAWLERLRDRFEDAETDAELADVWSDLRRYHKGDRPERGTNWTQVRLKDYFRNRGMWDEDEQWPVIPRENDE